MKKIVSLILCMTLLLSSFALLTSCKKNKGGNDDEINYDIDLTQKPTLEILMPNSGKSIDAVNSSPNALLIEQLTGYKANYTQLPAADAAKVLNTELMDKKPYDAMKLTKDQ